MKYFRSFTGIFLLSFLIGFYSPVAFSATGELKTREDVEQKLNELKKNGKIGGNFKGWNLDGVDLSNLYFDHVEFDGASCKDCKFNNSTLYSVWGREGDFTGADFTDAKISGNFRKAKFINAIFVNSTFTANAGDGDFTGADFTKATIREEGGTNFTSAIMKDVIFREADIDTEFIDTDLTGADFRGAIMQRKSSNAWFKLFPIFFRSIIIPKTKPSLIHASSLENTKGIRRQLRKEKFADRCETVFLKMGFWP